jgi:hypothetical protein
MESVRAGVRPLLMVLTMVCCGAVAHGQDAASAGSGAPRQDAAAQPDSESSAPAGKPLSAAEEKALATAVNAAYYHPDGLGGMTCTAEIDWTSLSKAMATTPDAAGRLKSLEGMTIQVHALRGQPAQVNVSWPQGAPANAASMEDGVKQMVGGLFQSYWTVVAGPALPEKATGVTVQERPGGGKVLHYDQNGARGTEEIDSQNVPVKATFGNASMKGSTDLHFSPSPNPKPGDVRRLTGVDTSVQMGSSSLDTHLTMDYQTVDGFEIPRHVVFGMPGAFSIPLELSKCSVTREAKGGS